jgi:hypothetical protein
MPTYVLRHKLKKSERINICCRPRSSQRVWEKHTKSFVSDSLKRLRKKHYGWTYRLIARDTWMVPAHSIYMFALFFKVCSREAMIVGDVWNIWKTTRDHILNFNSSHAKVRDGPPQSLLTIFRVLACPKWKEFLHACPLAHTLTLII